MVSDKQLYKGNILVGAINGKVFEIIEIKKEIDGEDYIKILDIETKEKFQYSKRYLKGLLIDGFLREQITGELSRKEGR